MNHHLTVQSSDFQVAESALPKRHVNVSGVKNDWLKVEDPGV
jgi:hypothetical protein